MTRHHRGLPPGMDAEPLFQGLTREQRSRAFDYEALGFGPLGQIVAVLRGTDEESRQMQVDWENILLIRHQGILFAYGYSREERQCILRHLEQLRAADRYSEEFAWYDRCNREE